MALSPWLLHAFVGSLFIKPLCAHVVLERSIDGGWHYLGLLTAGVVRWDKLLEFWQLKDQKTSLLTMIFYLLKHNGVTVIYVIFFHHTTCESTCDTLASSAANQGDNTVSVAQGGAATPGATKQFLPPNRVFKRNIYIYIYTRSTKSRHYIGHSFIFILVQFVI